MSCEKASRRFRFLLSKARRLGLNVGEVVELPAAKRLLSARANPRGGSVVWTIFAAIALILGGGAVLVLLCTPCVSRSRTHSSGSA